MSNQVAVTTCTPVYLTETEQGWHVVGTINGAKFTAQVDDVGNTIGDSLDCWLTTKHPTSREVCDDILAAIETAIIRSGADLD